MQFAAPEAFYLWLLVPALVLLHVWARRRRRRAAEALGDGGLVERLTLGAGPLRELLGLSLVAAGVFFVVLALARPQWGRGEQEVVAQGVDVFVVLDTSFSMDATDIAPSRMERARYVASQLMDRLAGNRLGVIAFSGSAFVQCPLTLDYGAARIFLDTVTTGIIPEPGTNIVAAIEAARKGFATQESKHKVLILLTDGEQHQGDARQAAAEAGEDGITIYAVGVGTPGGEPIPVRDERGQVTDYVRDDDGQPVLSRLDERTLGEIALATGGSYHRVDEQDREIEAVASGILEMEGAELESQLLTRFQERFYWPLSVALGLVLVEALVPRSRRRRGEDRGGET